MPRGWDDDSWYDDGDFPPVSSKQGRSGLVAAAVLSFVMAGFNALISSCTLVCGFFTAVIGHANELQGGFLPRELLQYVAVGGTVLGLLSALSFILQIVAGLALLRGRRWARSLTLCLSGHALFVALLVGYLIVATLAQEGLQEDRLGVLVLGVMILLFHLGYGVSEICLMLNRGVQGRLR